MINVNKLKAKIVENGMSVTDLSEYLPMNKATFYRKLDDGGERFTVGEVRVMAKVLHMTKDEVNAIFFADEVAEVQ